MNKARVLIAVACSIVAVCSVLGFTRAATMNSAQFDHKALKVRDLPKSAEFYKNVLGLERIRDPFNDDRHVFFRIGDKTELHLIAGAGAVPEQDIDVHIALRVASVDEFVGRLKDARVTYYNAKRESGKINLRPDGVKQVYFQDPDGYWIEVNDNKP